jgi:4-hydroxybenzoate polyprenyltransferase
VAAVAGLAGGGIDSIVRLGASMTFLQFAIGALNDIVGAPADVGRRPPKPIPSGVVSADLARVVAVVCAGIGLLLAGVSGRAVLVLAFVVLAIGAVYDLLAKGTPWSWLPFAVGIPVLPVFGWLGATGTLAPAFAVLIPMAVLAGAGLAVANARADLETDLVAGTRSVATALGDERSWWTGAALMGAATAVGAVFAGRSGWTGVTVALIAIGTAAVASGLALGRDRRADARRRGWEAQAVGAAIAATGWVAGMIPGP